MPTAVRPAPGPGELRPPAASSTVGQCGSCVSGLLFNASGGGGNWNREYGGLRECVDNYTEVRLPSPRRVTSYSWQTGLGKESCDPVRWYLLGSNDSVTWTLLDDRTGAITCVQEGRQAWQGCAACQPARLFFRRCEAVPSPVRSSVFNGDCVQALHHSLRTASTQESTDSAVRESQKCNHRQPFPHVRGGGVQQAAGPDTHHL
eukprot:COSAG01_NODE_7392_length_3226_cov_11.354013_2_plen_204_part_00